MRLVTKKIEAEFKYGKAIFHLICTATVSFKYCTFFQASDKYPRVNWIKDGCSFRNLLNRHPIHKPPMQCLWTISWQFYCQLIQKLNHYYMDRNELLGRIKEVRLFRSQLMITQGTNRCQMKHMDNVFLQIHLSLPWVRWNRYYSLSKWSIFQNSQKCWKLTIFISPETQF